MLPIQSVRVTMNRGKTIFQGSVFFDLFAEILSLISIKREKKEACGSGFTYAWFNDPRASMPHPPTHIPCFVPLFHCP